jgi:hypothetical protein
MADDRMRNNDNLDRNMGGAGQKDQDKYGQKSPGRGQQDDEFTKGQRGAGGSNIGQGGQNRQNR